MVRAAFDLAGRVERRGRRVGRVAEGWRTGPRTYLAAVEAELTPNLRAGEFRAHTGKIVLCVKRLRMRGTEDPTSPLEHVLEDGLGFE